MDPLSPNNITPSWSTSPPRFRSALPYLSPARTRPKSNQPTSPAPTIPASSPFREPKVFGAPGLSLPASSSGSGDTGASGSQSPRKDKGREGGFVRVRIGVLERNRKDLLIRFDANTNLPNFRTGTYRNMQRSYVEFQRFAEQIQMTSPQTIIPALPLATTSAVTDEEVRIALQRWLTRICEDPVLLKDDELRSFIESDFGYSPIPPPTARRIMTTTSAVPQVFTAALSKVVRRGPLDEDDELQSARGAVEKLEERWGSAAVAVGNLGKGRKAVALANAEMGARFVSLSTVESDASLAQAERKVGRAWEQLSGMGAAQAASENVVLSDSLGYQALNARAAKRTQILEDSQNATKNAINKRRNVERLKGSSSINPSKVDDALHEMEDANNLEDQLSSRLNAISQNLHVSLRAHSRQTHEDVAVALLENARLSIGYHKHLLRELEALKPDLARVGTGAPISTVSTTGPVTPSKVQQPHMAPSRPYQAQAQDQPPRAHAPPLEAAGSRSMFLPPAPASSQATPPRPGPGSTTQVGQVDPLGGGVAQSMILPSHQNGQPRHPGPAQTLGRAQGRKLDERQAAKMLAGGF